MNRGALLERLFSRATIAVLALIILVLFGASLYSYLADRKLQATSLSDLRLLSWNLARLDNETAAFDQEMSLMAMGVGDPEELTLRYDILWSRYDYLLQGPESKAMRQFGNNESQLTRMFFDLQALEKPLFDHIDKLGDTWTDVLVEWNNLRADTRQLVTDSFVGGEASRVITSVENSRGRLANLRFLILAALATMFLYLILAVTFLRRQSKKDPITGLPNISYLQSMQRVSPDKIIIICEIRQFKLVLSDFGTESGNELVKLFVLKLQKQLLPADQLMQISRSEFLLIFAARPSETENQTVSNLAAATNFDWQIGNSVMHISGIFGVSPPSEAHGLDWDGRYQQAYRALSQAHLEALQICINEEDLRRGLEEDRQIHAGLLRLFDNEPGWLRLSLVYQPIVKVEDRHFVTGAEVLLRCHDENVGFVPPNRVVDLCEKFNLGVPLGQWLFRQIAIETRQLYEDMSFLGNLSINLNPAMLTDDLAGNVQKLLIDEGIPATVLCMEITEDNAALDFTLINQLITSLHDLGIMFALDDFGTGHSSLEYVRELRIDRLKIDRCFVDGIEHNKDKARFLRSIIAMAEKAYMKSVIEGVENEAQWQLIEKMGGTLIQGYHAHRPMPLNDYIALLLKPETGYPELSNCQPPQSSVKKWIP